MKMKSFSIQKDESIIDSEGNVIFLGYDRFVSDICLGKCCFMCGSSPEDKEFNDEHVIPNWVLKKLNIFNRHITLPNFNKVRYDQYKVSCCVECNSFFRYRIRRSS